MSQFSIYTGARNIKVNIPEKNFLYFAEHPHCDLPQDESILITQALDHPIDSEKLDEIPLNAKVLIVVDDATRPTPTARIIPFVLERIKKRTSNITFATAPGTHRPLTDAELCAKLGRDVLENYNVVNVNYKESEHYKYVETTALGTPIYIHECVLAADFLITIGNIAPHNMVGWSGGAKMLQPGLSGEQTTSHTHLAGALNYKLLDVLGNVDCRTRQEIDEIGGKLGLNFIINTVLDEQKNILGMFCGHYIHAHRQGVAFAQKALCPSITALADIVIVSAYPCCIDFWQGFKPLAFSLLGVKKGGTIIYLFDPPEGLCGNSPAHKQALKTYLKADKQRIQKDLDSDIIQDLVGITNPLGYYQILSHANIICVTNNLTSEECDLLSFTKADSIETALETAFGRQGHDAKIGIIPFGGETLVRVADPS
jgi:nickel-dependent lactate racemase